MSQMKIADRNRIEFLVSIGSPMGTLPSAPMGTLPSAPMGTRPLIFILFLRDLQTLSKNAFYNECDKFLFCYFC
jgi:hypothetical protein